MHLVYFSVAICFSSYAHQDKEPLFVRVWNRIFSPQEQTPSVTSTCDNCKNGLPQKHTNIDTAYLTRGQSSGGGASSGTASINTLISTPSSLSDDAQVAIEREKTRQLEIAENAKLQIEHERNKWFNTLELYKDEAMGQQFKELADTLISAQKDQQERFLQTMAGFLALDHAMSQKLLNEHHGVMNHLIKQYSENELKREKIRLKGLPQQLEHDIKKTEMLHKQAVEKMKLVGSGISNLLQDEQRLKNGIIAASALTLAVFAASRGTRVVADYSASLLMKPALVTETSRFTITQLLRRPHRIFSKKEKLPRALYNHALQKQVDTYVGSIKKDKINGLPYRNALFYGEPGTGKTLLAKIVAQQLGMHYAIVPAPNIHQYSDKESIQELNRLFKWANNTKKGTVIFFDEVDAMAPKRTNSSVSEQTRKIQNTLYALTGSENKKSLVIGATNTPKILDDAFLSRMDEKLYFPLPDQVTRAALLQQNFQHYIGSNKAFKCELDLTNVFDELSYHIDGFSGREISQLIRALPAKAYTAEGNILTMNMVYEATAEKIQQRMQLKNHTEL